MSCWCWAVAMWLLSSWYVGRSDYGYFCTRLEGKPCVSFSSLVLLQWDSHAAVYWRPQSEASSADLNPICNLKPNPSEPNRGQQNPNWPIDLWVRKINVCCYKPQNLGITYFSIVLQQYLTKAHCEGGNFHSSSCS